MKSGKIAELKKLIREKMLEEMDFTREVSDEEVMASLDQQISKLAENRYVSLKERERLRRDVFNSLRRYDILQDYLENPEVTEIMVNSPDDIFIERAGRLEKLDVGFDSERRLEDIAQQMASASNRRINEASPITDSRLPEFGARVNIVLKPVAINGPTITIRKFKRDIMQMESLVEKNALSEETAEFLKKLVQAGYNILVCGGTGAGKTTFLNALSNYISPEERVITIEDSAELQLQNLPNLVRLETRNSNCEGNNEITIRDLIKSSLRMRPDRIVVGEVRGPEAIDMLQACNTGHEGSLSTLHANSAEDVISRLETMVLMGLDIPLAAIRKQIASAIDIIVQLGRLRDRSRRVLEICEVIGGENGEVEVRPLYVFVEQGQDADGNVLGSLEKTAELKYTDKLSRRGLAG